MGLVEYVHGSRRWIDGCATKQPLTHSKDKNFIFTKTESSFSIFHQKTMFRFRVKEFISIFVFLWKSEKFLLLFIPTGGLWKHASSITDTLLPQKKPSFLLFYIYFLRGFKNKKLLFLFIPFRMLGNHFRCVGVGIPPFFTWKAELAFYFYGWINYLRLSLHI